MRLILPVVILITLIGSVLPACYPLPPAVTKSTTTLSPTHVPAQTTHAIPLTSTPSATPPSEEIAPLLQLIEQSPESTQLISRTFQWSYGDNDWTWDIVIPQVLYDYYKALPRTPTRNYSIYVTHPLDDEYIGILTNKFQQCAQQEGYDSFQTVSLVAAFVQSLQYTSDSITTGFDEYPRYPTETLVDNGGDCEDTAILLAALINSLGYGVVLIRFPQTADAPGHCGVGVKGDEGIYGSYYLYNEVKYYYLETTGSGWELGELPPEYHGVKANVYPMVPVPILTAEWTSKAKGLVVELKVTVNNLGSALAENVYVYAGFDAGNDQCWNPGKSSLFQLDVNESVVATLYLTPP